MISEFSEKGKGINFIVNQVLHDAYYESIIFSKNCNGNFSLIEQIFSVKDRKVIGVKHKVVKILGFQLFFKLRNKQG